MRNYGCVQVDQLPRDVNVLIVGYSQRTEEEKKFRPRPITKCSLDEWGHTSAFIAGLLWYLAFWSYVFPTREFVSERVQYIIAAVPLLFAVVYHFIGTIWIVCCFQTCVPD
jgi:hypothetical protein